MIVRLSKPTCMPDQMYDGSEAGAMRPCAWVRPGVYELFEARHDGETVYLLPDTSLGASLEWWRSIDGYGGVRLIE